MNCFWADGLISIKTYLYLAVTTTGTHSTGYLIPQIGDIRHNPCPLIISRINRWAKARNVLGCPSSLNPGILVISLQSTIFCCTFLIYVFWMFWIFLMLAMGIIPAMIVSFATLSVLLQTCFLGTCWLPVTVVTFLLVTINHIACY